jgi:hypothetical protein
MLDDDKGLPITPEEWIHKGSQTSIEENPLAVELQQRHEETKKSLRNAEILLKRWVIRHTKPKKLSNSTTDRRKVLPGAAIKDDSQQGGLEIEGAALLPFLLAARATAISSRKSARALFAEGLASSYEAYINTRKGNVGIDENNNDDDDVYADDDCDNDLAWYLGNLDKALKGSKSRSSHQKVSATIDKAIELWHAGEKVLIFCHYRETGRALEVHLNQRVKDEIAIIVRQRFGIAKSEAWSRMKNIQKRFGDRDDRLRQETDQELSSITNSYGFKDEEGQKVRDIMRRYLSTPSFLARYFTAKKGALTEALRRKDGSGLTIREQFEKFCHFLAERCVDDERLEYIDALDHIRKGSNVRLANGETPHETRRRLLLAFNTPFYPEILIASSVLSEGVDLHLNCRYIIHHDLCWNPSTMEQRTGRIDRIGAKAEITQKPIYIYLPYIAATQDEKMYRVVRDRERWFKVIMGEHYSVDEYSTDKLAIRVPFPEEMAEELALKLGVFYQA